MTAQHPVRGKQDHPHRTTLLELVQSLTRLDRTPDEVVQTVHESLDSGKVVLIGNFRDGLTGPRKAPARPDSPREDSWRQAMAKAQAGDSVAYHQLFRELLPEVSRLVRSKVFDASAAEDVVQKVLLAIHRARHTYRSERPFGPWLRAIVRNTTINHLRQLRRHEQRAADAEIIERTPDPKSGEGSEQKELSADLTRMLSGLPPAQREAIELMQIEGLSSEEAARSIGISASAIRLRAHRGYRTLRKRLNQREWCGR